MTLSFLGGHGFKLIAVCMYRPVFVIHALVLTLKSIFRFHCYMLADKVYFISVCGLQIIYIRGAIINSHTSTLTDPQFCWDGSAAAVHQHGSYMEDVTTETDVRLPSTPCLLKLNTTRRGMMGFVPAGVSHLEHSSLRFSQFIERWFSSCHFYDGAAQRPDVRWLAIPPRTLVYDFRSHVL